MVKREKVLPVRLSTGPTLAEADDQTLAEVASAIRSKTGEIAREAEYAWYRMLWRNVPKRNALRMLYDRKLERQRILSKCKVCSNSTRSEVCQKCRKKFEKADERMEAKAFQFELDKAPKGIAERLAWCKEQEKQWIKGIVSVAAMKGLPHEKVVRKSAVLQQLRFMIGELENRAATTKSKAVDPNAWPDLKSLALFHAYRVEAGDDSADIDPDNAKQVAHEAGHKAESSGKTLLESFRKYATGNSDKRKRERTKEGKRPGDVVKRFNVVLLRLAAYPDALKIAEAERAIVRTRSNEIED